MGKKDVASINRNLVCSLIGYEVGPMGVRGLKVIWVLFRPPENNAAPLPAAGRWFWALLAALPTAGRQLWVLFRPPENMYG